MTKLKFPPEPYLLFRLGKTFTHMLHAFALSFVKLCDPYERFVMLSKSRSRIHHPHILMLLHWEYEKTCFHLDPPKNILLLHWR
jgi:hypothetical protein